MKRTLMVMGLFGMLCGVALGASSSIYTMPIMLVTPRLMDFKLVPAGTTVTNHFVVENVGNGRLVGSATVAPPFKIISGGEYSLKYGDAQIVTITYTPSASGTDERTVKFTGGNGATVPVVGKLAPARPSWR